MNQDSVEGVAIVGAGFMGSGIAESVAVAGIRAFVYEPERAPLERSRIVNDRRFRDLPMLLETPKEEGRAKGAIEIDRHDERNLNMLRSLIVESTQRTPRRQR